MPPNSDHAGKKREQWVPLFIPTSTSGNRPLATSTVLPSTPSPRRTDFANKSPPATFSPTSSYMGGRGTDESSSSSSSSNLLTTMTTGINVLPPTPIGTPVDATFPKQVDTSYFPESSSSASAIGSSSSSSSSSSTTTTIMSTLFGNQPTNNSILPGYETRQYSSNHHHDHHVGAVSSAINSSPKVDHKGIYMGSPILGSEGILSPPELRQRSSPQITTSARLADEEMTTTILNGIGGGGSKVSGASHTSAMSSVGTGGTVRGQHFRRRSSSTSGVRNLPYSESSAMMERMTSMTTMMEKHGKQGVSGAHGGSASSRYPSTTRWSGHRKKIVRGRWANPYRLGLLLTVIGGLFGAWRYSQSKYAPSYVVLPTSAEFYESLSDAAAAGGHLTPWLAPYLLSVTETVPYPTSTHPRTPPLSEDDTLSLSDYLSTRLGSHYSSPTAKEPSHLWVTTASNVTVRMTTPHLNAFVQDLDEKAVHHIAKVPKVESVTASSKKTTVSEMVNETSTNGTTSTTHGHKLHDSNAVNLEEANRARRQLVVICLDEGCMEFCRLKKQDWFCFGGLKVGGGEEWESKRREITKMKAAIQVLESGRRVFLTDGDVYFKRDPVPYLGNLQHYDMQIPDSWGTGNSKAGFSVLNPTQNLIQLWKRMLDIALGGDQSWANTNLLLDPEGAKRFNNPSTTAAAATPKPSKPKSNQDTDNEDDDSAIYDDTTVISSGYGQAEFESPWATGMDVKVLDRKKFKSHTGKLEATAFMNALSEEAIYFHCVCCGDSSTVDFIAGALGYYQPKIHFPAISKKTEIPGFPMMITTPAMSGTRAQLSFMMGLLLQSSRDSSRSFVPPLKGHVHLQDVTKPPRERYVWRMFPIGRWVQGIGSGRGLMPQGRILEPVYIQHAISHLKTIHAQKPAALKAITELTETLYIDCRDYPTYKDMVKVLTRPFYSEMQVVTFEHMDAVFEKEGWTLRDEYKNLDSCWDEDVNAELSTVVTGHCTELCRPVPLVNQTMLQ